MHCAIYKGDNKANTFLFIEQKDEFARLPETLLQLLGKLTFIMELELTPNRALAQANPRDVLEHLESQGYYIQMPPSQGHILDR